MYKKVFDSFLYGMCPLIFIFCYLLLGSGLLVLSKERLDVVMCTCIVDAIAVFVGIFYYKKVKCIGTSEPRSLNVFIVVLGIFSWLVGQICAQYIILNFNDSSFSDYQTEMKSSAFFLLLLSLVCAPSAEEILIRGVLYNSWKRFNIYAACIVQTSVFTLLHGTAVHIPICILFSVFQALVYERTHKIYYCIIFHFCYNFLAYFVPDTDISYSNMANVVLIAIYAILFLILFYYYWQEVLKNKKSSGTV